MSAGTRSQSGITNGMQSHYPVRHQNYGYYEMPSKHPCSLAGGAVGGNMDDQKKPVTNLLSMVCLIQEK